MIKYRIISKPDPKSHSKARYMAQRKVLGIWINMGTYWSEFEENAMTNLQAYLNPPSKDIKVLTEFVGKPSIFDKLLGLDK